MNELADKSVVPDSKLEKWSYRAFLAGVFGITFSIAMGESFLVLSLVGLCIYLCRARRLPVFPFVGWVIVFVFWAQYRTLFGQNPTKGVPRLTRMFWFAVAPLAATLVNSKERRLQVLKVFAVGCGILFIDVTFVKPIKILGRMGVGDRYEGMSLVDALIDRGSMTDGEMLMVGIVLTLGLVAITWHERKRARWWIVLLVLQLVALFVNFKRGSWLVSGAMLSVIVGWRWGKKPVLAMLICLLLVALTPPAQKRFSEVTDQFNLKRGARWAMWTKVAPKMIKEYPWGIGYGSCTSRLLRKYHWYVNGRREVVEPDRSHLHSNIFQVLVETGWLGFCLYAGWMLHAASRALYKWIKSRRGPPDESAVRFILMLGLLAIYLSGLVEYNFGDAELLIALMLLVGMIGNGVSSDSPATAGQG